MGRKNNRKVEPRKRLPSVWEVNNHKKTGSETRGHRKTSSNPSGTGPPKDTYRVIRPKRMEIWFARLDLDISSSIQGGDRPVLIISNDGNNDTSTTVTVLPMTSKKKHPYMKSHTWLDKDLLDGMNKSSMVLAEQITTIDKKQLVHKIGVCEDEEIIKQIDRSIRIQLGMEDKINE